MNANVNVEKGRSNTTWGIKFENKIFFITPLLFFCEKCSHRHRHTERPKSGLKWKTRKMHRHRRKKERLQKLHRLWGGQHTFYKTRDFKGCKALNKIVYLFVCICFFNFPDLQPHFFFPFLATVVVAATVISPSLRYFNQETNWVLW